MRIVLRIVLRIIATRVTTIAVRVSSNQLLRIPETRRDLDGICRHLQSRSLGIDFRVTIFRARVIAEETTTTAAGLLFDRPEHVGEIARIVSSIRHDAGAEQVSFGFIFAAVSKQKGRPADLTTGRHHRT